MHKFCLFLTVFSIACGDDSSVDAGGFDAATDTPLTDVSSVDAVVVDAGLLDALVTPDVGERCAPGESRTVPCERCGSAPQNCRTTGLWETPGECFDQGVCEVAEVAEEALAMCATRRRLCLDTCEWSDWGDGVEAGECEVDEERPVDCLPNDAASQVCGDDCAWQAPPACTSACTTSPRESPADAREMCIPGGEFIRGDPVDGRFIESVPTATVEVSSFLIDRYPVTYRRYLECVDAGVCSENLHEDSPSLTDSANADIPVIGVGREDAWRFCRWDGGRRLPTLQEWEKSARGPIPRAVDYVWETDPDCAQWPRTGCPNHWARTDHIRLRFEDYDWSASFYGVAGMTGGVVEPTADSENSIGTEVDALGSPGGSVRGFPYYGTTVEFTQAYLFTVLGGRFYPEAGGIRCVRSDEGHERSWESELPTLGDL
jgi:formylglycine-generating enzyme required for sulfatase activity